mmetsp:Transcript_60826/g.143226  ORF Transcript_60826/g.143226 Transcript_60826/m.143226 type:complete len:392 (-) Transcript_60826:122-1297(-)
MVRVGAAPSRRGAVRGRRRGSVKRRRHFGALLRAFQLARSRLLGCFERVGAVPGALLLVELLLELVRDLLLGLESPVARGHVEHERKPPSFALALCLLLLLLVLVLRALHVPVQRHHVLHVVLHALRLHPVRQIVLDRAVQELPCLRYLALLPSLEPTQFLHRFMPRQRILSLMLRAVRMPIAEIRLCHLHVRGVLIMLHPLQLSSLARRALRGSSPVSSVVLLLVWRGGRKVISGKITLAMTLANKPQLLICLCFLLPEQLVHCVIDVLALLRLACKSIWGNIRRSVLLGRSMRWRAHYALQLLTQLVILLSQDVVAPPSTICILLKLCFDMHVRVLIQPQQLVHALIFSLQLRVHSLNPIEHARARFPNIPVSHPNQNRRIALPGMHPN